MPTRSRSSITLIVSVPLATACWIVLVLVGWSVCDPDAISGTAALLPSLSVTASVSAGVPAASAGAGDVAPGVRAKVTGPLPVTCMLVSAKVPSNEALSR